MLNYLKKFALDVVPSVVATILGAYIVNHYITAKTATDTPPAAVASTPNAGNKKADPKKVAVKPAEAPAEVATVPEPGVKAKGISERAMIETRAAERPAEVKPTETASVPAEPKAEPKSEPKTDIKRVQTPAPKAVAKISPAQTTTPAQTAAPAAPETASASDEPRDANELALEAIKRLRATTGDAAAPRAQEAVRQSEPQRAQEPPRTAVVVPVAAPPATVRPLPPPIVLGSPADNSAQTPTQAPPPYTASVDPNRPTPPADIPPPRPPVDLKAEAANAVTHTKNVAEDMLAAAKSMFHAVIPGSDRQSSSASQFTD